MLDTPNSMFKHADGCKQCLRVRALSDVAMHSTCAAGMLCLPVAMASLVWPTQQAGHLYIQHEPFCLAASAPHLHTSKRSHSTAHCCTLLKSSRGHKDPDAMRRMQASFTEPAHHEHEQVADTMFALHNTGPRNIACAADNHACMHTLLTS